MASSLCKSETAQEKMILSYTHHEFNMMFTDRTYLLPNDILYPDLTDEEVIQKTLEWFQEAFLFTAYWKSTKRTEHDTILLTYSYEGYDGYYPFKIEFKLARFKQDPTHPKIYAIPDGCPILQLNVIQEESGLFHELLNLKVIPEFINRKNLTSYYTFREI